MKRDLRDDDLIDAVGEEGGKARNAAGKGEGLLDRLRRRSSGIIELRKGHTLY